MDQHYNRIVWWLVAVMAALTVASFSVCDLTIAPFSNPPMLGAIGIVFATSQVYRHLRPDPRLQAISEAMTQMLLILLLGELLTYPAVKVGFPFCSGDLYAIDQALGLHRAGYLAFFAQHPWLAVVLKFAYLSMLPQFAVVPLLLFACNRFERLQRLIIAVAIGLLLTVLISVFTPSLTAFVYVDVPKLGHLPAGIYTNQATMEALHAGILRVIHLDNLEGLVGFPSFHTVSGLLFIWALWPLRKWRWPALALNLALIAATPIDGRHYFIDIAGGSAVAVLAAAASYWLCRYVKRAATQPVVADVPGCSPASG